MRWIKLSLKSNGLPCFVQKRMVESVWEAAAKEDPSDKGTFVKVQNDPSPFVVREGAHYIMDFILEGDLKNEQQQEATDG